MRIQIFIIYFLLFSSCINSQSNRVGGSCEGCEAIYEYGTKTLSNTDTISGFHTMKTKIKLSGIVYKKDGKTPAKDVILYFYQTNDEGKYPTRANSSGWERRHGYLRGWVKTNNDGKYVIYTSRPASYPNTRIPQHIHVTVKEPNKNPYRVDDFFFSDDPNLPSRIRNSTSSRGGSGVIELKGDEIKTATRDIILGLNISNY